MHTGDELPKVSPDTPMNQVLYEISNKRLGLTTIVDEQEHLLGIFTDGDLRRLIDKTARFRCEFACFRSDDKNHQRFRKKHVR